MPRLLFGASLLVALTASANPARISDVRYGLDALQSLDLYLPKTPGPHPILAFVHGGEFFEGDKSQHQPKGKAFAAAGVIFAAVNHRLSPAVRHPAHVQDIVLALKYLREHAAEWSGDPSRLFLSGHSAGAHLAALVGTDEQFLHSRGMGPEQLAGVMLLDGAGYDVPRRLRRTIPEVRRGYELAFGTDPQAWAEVSPPRRVLRGEPLPPFLLLYAGTARSPRVQAISFAHVLRAAGTRGRLVHVPDRNHVTIEQRLGQPRDKAFAEMLRFIDKPKLP
ncbi:MAG: alpha/beta hydrolase [Myxococcaceae bacterium]